MASEALLSYVWHLSASSDLWPGFPGNMKDPMEACKYVSLWWDLLEILEELTPLTAAQKDLIVVCSFCALPEPPPGALKRRLPKLEGLSHYLDSPSEWGSKIKEVVAGFFAVPASYHPSNTTVAALLPLVEQATEVKYCRHCLHCQPRCKCTGASGGPPLLADFTAPVPSSAPPGLTMDTGATGSTDPPPVATSSPIVSSAPPGLTATPGTAASTAVVTPMSALLGTTTQTKEERRQAWRAQIAEMRSQTRRLEEEANADWMEFQEAALALHEAKMKAALQAKTPPLLRLHRPPTPGVTLPGTRQPSTFQSSVAGHLVVPSIPPSLGVQSSSAPQPTWSERVEDAERMDTSQAGPREGTPYQQQVSAPAGTTGIGLVGSSTALRASYSEAAGRGRGVLRGRPTLRGVSRGGGRGRGVPQTSSPSPREGAASSERAAPPHGEEPIPPNPAASTRSTGQKKSKYRGWKHEIHTFAKDVAHREHPDLSDRALLGHIHTVLEHMDIHYSEWYYRREMEPLGFMPYVTELFRNLCGLELKALSKRHDWIKPHGFHHQRAASQPNFKEATHLQGLRVPRQELPRPSLEARSQAKKEVATARQTLDDCRVAPASLDNDVASAEACKCLEKALIRYEQLLQCYGEVDPDTRFGRLELDYMQARGSRRQGAPSKPTGGNSSKGSTPKSSGAKPKSSPQVGAGGDVSTSQPKVSTSAGGPGGSPPSHKKRKGLDGRPSPRPVKALPLPFPLAPNKDRVEACYELMEQAPDDDVRSPVFYHLVLARFPLKGEHELVRISNQLYIGCMEYHLTMASRADAMVSPQVPLEVSETYRRLKEYLPEGVDVRTGDFREVERAKTLRFLCWLLRADYQADKAPDEPHDPLSTRKEDFPMGTVLRLFMAPQVTDISYEEVLLNVLHENVSDLKLRAEEAEKKLEDLLTEKDGFTVKVQRLEVARDAARGSSSPRALEIAEDAVVEAKARLKASECAVRRQHRYVARAWEAYNLGCERLQPKVPEVPPEEPPQELDQEEPMDEDMDAEQEDEGPEQEGAEAGEEDAAVSLLPASQEADDTAITEEDDRMLDVVEDQQAAVSTELSGLNLDSPSGAAAAPQD